MPVEIPHAGCYKGRKFIQVNSLQTTSSEKQKVSSKETKGGRISHKKFPPWFLISPSYANEESKSAQSDWSQYHCPNWSASRILIGCYGASLIGQYRCAVPIGQDGSQSYLSKEDARSHTVGTQCKRLTHQSVVFP